ncbi:MAG TPA: hypothetical protein VFR32_05110 [Gaiellaceae bacterium]|nr:hypothetical protein [Gaiellaceae bacterium]
MRPLLAAVLVAATAAASSLASSQATTTVSCAQLWTGFNVQLIGDRDWGWNLGALGSVGAPKEKSMIVVWSLGGYAAQNGLNVYDWATATRARPSPRCTVVKAQQKQPSLAGLGSVTRVKDGWAFGRKFLCLDAGRLLITTTKGRGKSRIVVRMQRSGKVIAVGELASGGGWIRGSKTCQAREK